MKGLAGLIKIQESALENCRKALVDIEKQKQIVELQIAELTESIEREGELTGESIEAAAAFSAFLSGALTRKNALQVRVDALAIDVENAQELVAEAFRELRKLETAEEIAQNREALRTRRREQSTMDEVALGMRRRSDPSSTT